MPYANPEAKRAHDAAYRAARRAALAAKQREFYQRTRPERDATNKRWMRGKPFAYRAITFANGSNRRAQKQGCEGHLFGRDVKLIVGPCAYCGRRQETWDHRIPLCRQGPNILSNLVPVCTACNRSKARKLLAGLEWDGPDPEAWRRK